ncbi:MAG: SusC/RagA family TonB-linked outer membrane protein [Phaeodactylibacter sp.]|nr:SusC/RagA family TonB-linked outer membrane protein [Phaeodactylibacter sp.]MCB9052368.1 SusC/RagA family TonB-linked outer membrane protein [Lewinellaceae bacterium]
MKPKLVLLSGLMLCAVFAWGQNTVNGTVVAQDGEPLIGVNIIEVGTNNGAITDLEGNFSLQLITEKPVLEFSYTGYGSQRIAVEGKTNIVCTLKEGIQMEEVVVTAIGVTREKKALSYSISQVNADEISTVKDNNPVNSLVGKVAGVVITQATGGPGAGSRVLIRGNNSITANNQPLIVVDGMPIDDVGSNSGGSVYNSTVTGGGITDINPDDIESISVLKGPNAAALYGSRAGNGVLLITTKKGRAGRGIGVSINSNVTFDSPMFLPDYQNEYGQGTQGNVPGSVSELKNASASWGPKLDGSSELYYTGETRPYVAQPDNVKDFFRTAGKYINTLALDGGTEAFNMRFSYTNSRTESVLPNSDLENHNFTLRAQTNLSDRLSIDAKATYFTQDIQNRASLGSEGILSYVYYMPRNVAIDDLKTYQIPEESLSSVSYSALGANPYWMLYNDKNTEDRNRILGFGKATYRFTNWLSAFVRVGSDVTNIRRESINQAGHHFWASGRLNFGKIEATETNADFLVMANAPLGESFDLSVNVGGNHSYRTYQESSIYAEDFKIPTRAFVANSRIIRPSYVPFQEKKINSLYASASLSYGGFAYLDITGRNDWSSTLSEDNNSYFYPSVGLSFLLTRFVDPNSRTFNLVKVRGNWAQVGNDTGPYQLYPYYTIAQDGYLGRTTLSRPSVKFNPDLKPENINSLEFGAEIRMLNDRVFADFSVYDIETVDLIYDVPVPPATGYSTFRENIGKMTNKGFELLLGGAPVRSSNFNWEIAFNYTHNKNELVELFEELESHQLNTTNSGNVVIQATVGGGYGDIYGTTWRTTDDGRIIVNAEGRPLATAEKVYLGNAQPDWIGGVTNTFSYKNFSLRFLIDARIGGQIYSVTNAELDASGVSTQSLKYREGGILVDGVVEQEDGSYVPNSTTISAQDYWGAYSGIASNYVFDQDNIRLREAVLGYTLPRSVIGNSFLRGATISLIGRNLFFLSKTIDHVDPEASLGTANGAQGILIANLPTLRSIGFNLSLQF